MRRQALVAVGFALVAVLGLWLWSRNGLVVWVDAAIAFCS